MHGATPGVACTPAVPHSASTVSEAMGGGITDPDSWLRSHPVAMLRTQLYPRTPQQQSPRGPTQFVTPSSIPAPSLSSETVAIGSEKNRPRSPLCGTSPATCTPYKARHVVACTPTLGSVETRSPELQPDAYPVQSSGNLRTRTQQPGGGFKTAGGKAVVVSDAARARAEAMIASTVEEDGKAVEPSLSDGGFKTAGGKAVAVSDTARARAEAMIASTVQADGSATACESGQESRQASPPHQLEGDGGVGKAAFSSEADDVGESDTTKRSSTGPMSRVKTACNGFATAAGAHLQVSSSAREAAAKLVLQAQEGRVSAKTPGLVSARAAHVKNHALPLRDTPSSSRSSSGASMFRTGNGNVQHVSATSRHRAAAFVQDLEGTSRNAVRQPKHVRQPMSARQPTRSAPGKRPRLPFTSPRSAATAKRPRRTPEVTPAQPRRRRGKLPFTSPRVVRRPVARARGAVQRQPPRIGKKDTMLACNGESLRQGGSCDSEAGVHGNGHTPGVDVAKAKALVARLAKESEEPTESLVEFSKKHGPPFQTTASQLSPVVRSLNSLNAMGVTFNPSTGALNDGSAGVVWWPAGVQWFHRSVLSAGCNPKLASQAWVANHFRWIVWKLGCMERAYPAVCCGNTLTSHGVMRQLLHRYFREHVVRRGCSFSVCGSP